MNNAETKTVLIQGFDRSGSTVISKTIGSAENVVLFMQPFNSGPIRKRMYQIWDGDMAEDEDKRFMAGLENGALIRTYIKSPWFDKHSTETKFIKGKIHVIKSTINHFTTQWINEDYPRIDQWAIWRDPIQILASLKRNGFINQWYGDAITEILPTVRSTEILSPYRVFIDDLKTEVQQAAFLIVVRSHFLFHHIDEDKLIDYHMFCESPTRALHNFLKTYGIEKIDESLSQTSHNLIGRDHQKKIDYKKLFGDEDHKFSINIFKPLKNMIENKFKING